MLSYNRAEAVAGHFSFLPINQVAVLLGDGLGAVLDLIDFTGTGGRVEDHYVELTDGKLQDKDLLLWVGQLGFRQDGILHHPALDLAENALCDEIGLLQGAVVEGGLQQ